MSIEAIKKDLKKQHDKLVKEASQIQQALGFLGVKTGDGRGRRTGTKLSPEVIEKLSIAAKKRWAEKRKAAKK